ncbi:hypothetical protein E2562_035042 [Oryza meyeriana var. granulata]|uniref:Uncharacterized protein n=1 Tax=Oryza meyeriana var. granulata TaxID=110450 RepID=A0A6G1BQA7_9ORYZ|nr:hypothetical protein E2562_035042 [Oryza meyeriana var. granulata]
MLRVVVSVSNVAASTLPREDLALYNNPRRVALQEALPRYDAKGIHERTSRMTPGPVRISGDGGDEVCHDSKATQAPGAGTTGGAVDLGLEEGRQTSSELEPPEVTETTSAPIAAPGRRTMEQSP